MRRTGLLIIILAFFLAGLTFALWMRGAQSPQQAAAPVETSGKALIGGPFQLVDHEGRTVTDENFRGKLMLVFFGFTNCPDICPTELQTMTAALEKLGADAEKVVPILISVDPARDTPEKMAAFVKDFDPRIVGLTGTPEQVEKAAKAYRVFYRKAPQAEGANPDDYMMDHSAFTYLMDGNGEYVTHFSFGLSPEKIADTIRKKLDEEAVRLTLG